MAPEGRQVGSQNRTPHDHTLCHSQSLPNTLILEGADALPVRALVQAQSIQLVRKDAMRMGLEQHESRMDSPSDNQMDLSVACAQAPALAGRGRHMVQQCSRSVDSHHGFAAAQHADMHNAVAHGGMDGHRSPVCWSTRQRVSASTRFDCVWSTSIYVVTLFCAVARLVRWLRRWWLYGARNGAAEVAVAPPWSCDETQMLAIETQSLRVRCRRSRAGPSLSSRH